jgi:outer membrane protein OmpA-like peptidoglycan-associated protein
MAFDLLNSVKSLFGNEFSGKIASMLGENETNIKTSLAGIVPTILTGLLHKAGSGDPSSILNMTREASRSGVLSNLTDAAGNTGILSKGADMLKGLFGDHVGNVTSLISGFSNIRESSVASLMSVATPAALGVLGRHATDTNMGAGGLLSFLNSQKDSILNAVPSGLNLAGALGLSSLAGIGSKLSSAVSSFSGSLGGAATHVAHATESKPGGSRWIWIVLVTIILLAIVMYLMKSCNSTTSNQAAAVTDTAAMAPDTTKIVAAPARESLKVKLPNGVELNAYKGGIEDQLVIFLNNPASKPGKDVWFDFDNLNFTTGSAELTPESMNQVNNIAAILVAYPKVKIKIGGYTDKTGDSLGNIKLSTNRANAVLGALKTTKAKPTQLLGAEGYGSQFAKAAADATDDQKKMDRRIAVSVRAM